MDTTRSLRSHPYGPRMGLGAILFAGCFVGDAADGLPCEQDADCGIGVACVEDPATSTRCCGGACVLGATTEASSTSTSTSTSVSTGETDTSSGTTGSESSSTTSVLLCGNGARDPGEECDPGISPCTDDCMLCGNGVVDDAEFCDPEDETLPADSVCEACTELVLFEWDAEATGAAEAAEREFVFPAFTAGNVELVWRPPNGPGSPIGSGPYPGGADVSAAGLTEQWPQSWLLTRPIEFPPLAPGSQLSIEIEQSYDLDFDAESTPQRFFDYGRVDLIADPSGANPKAWQPPVEDWIRVLPDDSYEGELINCDGNPPPSGVCFTGPMEPDPVTFCDDAKSTRGLAGALPDTLFESAAVPADDVQGSTQRLSFRLRYDCLNFSPENRDDAWQVGRVRVVVSSPG